MDQSSSSESSEKESDYGDMTGREAKRIYHVSACRVWDKKGVKDRTPPTMLVQLERGIASKWNGEDWK